MPQRVTRVRRAVNQIVWQVLRKPNVQNEKRKVTKTKLRRLNQGKQRGSPRPTHCLNQSLRPVLMVHLEEEGDQTKTLMRSRNVRGKVTPLLQIRCQLPIMTL